MDQQAYFQQLQIAWMLEDTPTSHFLERFSPDILEHRIKPDNSSLQVVKIHMPLSKPSPIDSLSNGSCIFSEVALLN
jgi:hypothetical protein